MAIDLFGYGPERFGSVNPTQAQRATSLAGAGKSSLFDDPFGSAQPPRSTIPSGTPQRLTPPPPPSRGTMPTPPPPVRLEPQPPASRGPLPSQTQIFPAVQVWNPYRNTYTSAAQLADDEVRFGNAPSAPTAGGSPWGPAASQMTGFDLARYARDILPNPNHPERAAKKITVAQVASHIPLQPGHLPTQAAREQFVRQAVGALVQALRARGERVEWDGFDRIYFPDAPQDGWIDVMQNKDWLRTGSGPLLWSWQQENKRQPSAAMTQGDPALEALALLALGMGGGGLGAVPMPLPMPVGPPAATAAAPQTDPALMALLQQLLATLQPSSRPPAPTFHFF